MARQPRFVVPGQPQHVIQRGVNRSAVFATEEDYRFYLEKLGEGCRKHECAVHAYVLMTNHVHLLVTPHTEGGIGKLMQFIGRYYVQYFNFQYRRTGTLWEGRYKATLVETERYLLTCYRYIELNPVRAGVVATPGEYPWSSYHFNALGQYDGITVPHMLYERLGRNSEERRAAYQGLFDLSIEGQILKDIRESTNKGWALGSDRFLNQIEQLTQRQTAPKRKGGDRRSKKFEKARRINRV